MAGLTWTKKHVASMADTLNGDYETVEDAARAALDRAMELLSERAKYAVVGQVYYTDEHGRVDPSHEAAVKVFLGLYDTETKAYDAAGELAASKSNGDRLATWVLPTFFGSPNEWHTERRKGYAEQALKAETKQREKFLAKIEKRQAEMEERAKQIRAMEREANQSWPCPTARIKRNECRHDPTC